MAISRASYVLIDRKTQKITRENSQTDIELSSYQINQLIEQKTLLTNYYLREQKLLLFAYQIDGYNQLLVLFIDDNLNEFTSYNDQLLKLTESIHLFLEKKPFSKKEIQTINQQHLYLKKTIIDAEISKQIERELYHHDYESEELLFSEIMSGNEDEVKRRYYDFQKNTQTGTLATESELRHRKNLLIVTVAVATRYAIRGGVPNERAYTLSDKLIQEIERRQEFEAEKYPELEIMLLFTKEVTKYRFLNYSPVVKKTCEYIEKNCYVKLSVPMVAIFMNYSVPHLSKRFKEEVGMTINQYILKVKIDESKRLLTFEQYEMSTISSLLNFTDTSYFIKVFKRFESQTPKEYYRKKNLQS